MPVHKINLTPPSEKQLQFFKSKARHIGYGGARGGGKAQPLDEPVLTPNGFVAMGDIRAGDFVIGKDGKEKKVLEVHPQGKQKHYKITTIDGASTRCSEGHLWDVKVSGNKNRQILDTNKLYQLHNSGINIFLPIYSLNVGDGELERRVITIEPIEELECQCLTVEGGLYVTKDYIITHNSWAMRTKFFCLALTHKNLTILLLRRTLKELNNNHLHQLLELTKGVADYKDKDKTFTFHSTGSRIVLGYCDAEKDVYNYQGHEYDVIGLEEATHFTEAQIQFLTTCNRNTKPDFMPRMYYTTNPGNVGHEYFKRIFINKEYTDFELEAIEKARERGHEEYEFIPARVFDNKYLMDNDPGYVDSLKKLPEHLKRAHLDGDWDVLEGQFFEEFRHDIHVVRPYTIPNWARRFVSIDWGYNDYTSVLWHACSDKNVVTYRELHINKTVASKVAKEVLELTGDEKIEYYVASPDMWQKRGNDFVMGESIADAFKVAGINLQKADNARVVGWQRVREFMSRDEEGYPYWQVFRTCRNLIKCLPMLAHSNKNPDDVATEPHIYTDAPDSLRYALMSRPSPAKKPNIYKPDPHHMFRGGQDTVSEEVISW